jgi:hypothetical protein
MTALPVRHAHEIALVSAEQRWLVEGLWGAEAVGIIGGEPKCCKSFLALDLAVEEQNATAAGHGEATQKSSSGATSAETFSSMRCRRTKGSRTSRAGAGRARYRRPSPPDPAPSALDRVEAILRDATAPLSLKALRSAAKMRAATASDALAALVTQGRARRSDKGYLIVTR